MLNLIGKTYEDPEGIWEVTEITEASATVKQIQEGNINEGKEMVVPIEEACTYLGVNIYTVFWIAGARDGETLAQFDDEDEAIKFADNFRREHESEFDPCCGGVGIVDIHNEPVNW